MDLTKRELETLYNSMSNENLCKKLQISKATLLNYLNKSGIKKKGKGNKTKRSKINIKG